MASAAWRSSRGWPPVDEAAILVAVSLVAVAAATGLIASWWWRPGHPAVSVVRFDAAQGIVLFTSTECSKCRRARQVAEQTGAPIREITYELEPGTFTAAGVEAVPLTIVIGRDGGVVAQFSGVPTRRALKRAVSASGAAP